MKLPIDPEWVADENVTVASGNTVKLTQPTTRLWSLTVRGTLEMGGSCPLKIQYCIDNYVADLTALKAARDGTPGTIFFNFQSGTMLYLR